MTLIFPQGLWTRPLNSYHYNGHYEDWYSDQPEDPHDDVHTTSSILLLSPVTLEELGTIDPLKDQSTCNFFKWEKQP